MAIAGAFGCFADIKPHKSKYVSLWLYFTSKVNYKKYDSLFHLKKDMILKETSLI